MPEEQERFSFAPPFKKKKEKQPKKWERASHFSGGLVLPRPTNEYGEFYDEGPFGVYMRTDEIYVVFDRRKPLGKWTVAAYRTLEGAVRSFRRFVRSDGTDDSTR